MTIDDDKRNHPASPQFMRLVAEDEVDAMVRRGHPIEEVAVEMAAEVLWLRARLGRAMESDR